MWIGQFQPKSQRSLKSSAATLLEIAPSSFLAAAGQGAFGRLRAEACLGNTITSDEVTLLERLAGSPGAL
jgi:hypothetical protein